MARTLSRRAHKVDRVNNTTGTPFRVDARTEREARMRIAQAIADNLGLAHADAARHADAVKTDGTPYTVTNVKGGSYTFELTPGGAYA